MNKLEITKEMSRFVNLAFVDCQNIGTGFLTRHCINSMTEEEIMDFSLETEAIIDQMVEALSHVCAGTIPENFECGTLFQYVFDKVVEAAYKKIMGEEIDTQFNNREAFEYHEPDLPEYIQLKLTNVVGKLAIISSEILQYLGNNDLKTADLSTWMPPYFMVAVTIAIQFAQEIDPNDDTEMQDYLNL